MSHLHAVLTGDLVLSTRSSAAQVDACMALIKSSANRLAATSRFHRYRGDGWQLYIGTAGQGLAMMVYLAARLRAGESLSSRMALGLGDVSGLEHGSLGTAGGTAFVGSGRALDAMPDGRWLALAGQGVDPLHHALMAYLDTQMQGWSPQQAEAVALSLEQGGYAPQHALAAQVGISRQAFAARLQTAGFALVEQATHAFAVQFGAGDADG
ncbi:hypothetical protein [Pseudotabrizicola algicola]|uniref:Uncharacterized protein n=1 Tax=Pseudotabrizicola algicola TaxID=2709381 RepID=A0A6B3RJL7_9RHOB|nr:hypothetical protein [Pseudotabrizicola algicola]NEX45333.1 hypothetical protein [Pseudotabrizicola algicola]